MPELEDFLQRAKSLEKKGAFKKPDYNAAAQYYLEASTIYIRQRDFGNAENVLSHALDLALKGADEGKKRKVQYNLAVCRYRLGKLVEARNICQEILNTVGLPEEEDVEVTRLLADIFEGLGEPAAATSLMEKVTAYYSKQANYDMLALSFRSSAQKFSKLGNQIESARNLSKAAEAYEKTGRPIEAAELYLAAGTQSLAASEPALSKFCLSESVRMYDYAAKQVPDGSGKAFAVVSYLLDGALPALLLGNYWEAIRACESALGLLRKEKITRGVVEPQFEILRYRLLNSLIDMIRNDPAAFARAKEIHTFLVREVKDRHQKMMATYLDPFTLSRILKRSDLLGIVQLLGGNMAQASQFLYVAVKLFNREGNRLTRRVSFAAAHKVLRCAAISIFLANEKNKLWEISETCRVIIIQYMQEERNVKAKLDMLMDTIYWSFSTLVLTQIVNPEADTTQIQEQFVSHIDDYISVSQSKIQHPKFLAYFIASKLIRNRVEELPQPLEFSKEIESSFLLKNSRLLIDFCLKRDKALCLAATKGLLQSEQVIVDGDVSKTRFTTVEEYLSASERIGITNPATVVAREIERLAEEGPLNVILKKAKEAEVAGHDHEAATLYEQALQRDYFLTLNQREIHSCAAAAYKRAGFQELYEAHLTKSQDKSLGTRSEAIVGFIYCQKCGTKLPADAMFCLKCGRQTRVAPPLNLVPTSADSQHAKDVQTHQTQ